MIYLSPAERQAIARLHPDTIAGVLLNCGWQYHRPKQGYCRYSWRKGVMVKFPMNHGVFPPEVEEHDIIKLLLVFSMAHRISFFEAIGVFNRGWHPWSNRHRPVETALSA
jgi:hypothetical protein